ncbi:MAG: YbaB/EbfC family nucleoid-associated protein [Clostridia bacterium]|nr:YbaB/EbfC family nucleoid-associated protein [Clostridia bacterium]
MKVRIPNQGPSRGDMLKQVQKMQEDMANLQADLDEREFSATSGGGMISVTVNGKHELKELKISPDAIDPDEPEMLEDLITVAINEAIANATKTSEEEMGAITGGLNIPGMPGLF